MATQALHPGQRRIFYHLRGVTDGRDHTISRYQDLPRPERWQN